ncbi:MAG TPA: lysylphosphatidylglycerol synthase transmembrane domain-containing protein [Dermatophilaceae bacterium]
MKGDSPTERALWHPTRKQMVQGVPGILLAIVLVIWWLPKIAQTSWTAVFDTLGHVGPGSVFMLYALMCLGLWSYTFTLTGSLPGLRHLHALIVNLCGSSAGNFLPGGGAAGVAVTYAAFRSWGFSRRAISTSVIVTGVWNLLARLILPVTALVALLVAGGNLPLSVVRGGLIGAAAGLLLLALFVAALASERVTRTIGRALNRVLRLLHRRFTSLHEVGVDDFITDQRVRIVRVVRSGGVKMTFGLAGYFAVFYVLFWQSLHVVGLRMAFSHMFAAYAVGRLLSAIGITPGGVGVTEGGAVAVLVAFGADPAQALAGTVLFSLYTHVMEVPIGALAFLGWALSKKTTRANGHSSTGDRSADTPVTDRHGTPGDSSADTSVPGSPGRNAADASAPDG